ncbi:M60 family metallopeptidase [uncultured Bacteroides sp.]|uniref:M60 family metallopeptidase n=1 Tax=uncultured Bacteroides sp. TaxID=162156 RepID=UPI002676F071|nr:M60 family metallopeptidase [uncultured Bacteroides sp.]
MKNCWNIPLFTILAFLSVMCDNEEPLYEESLLLKIPDKENINFDENGGEQDIEITSNGIWKAVVADGGKEWCKAVRSNGKLTVSVGKSDEKNVRNTSIDIILGNLKETINVYQLGWGKAILLSRTSADVPTVGGQAEVTVTTNIDYEIRIEDEEWIEYVPSTRSADEHPLEDNVEKFVIGANSSSEERRANIIFKDKEENGEIEPVEFRIIQSGLGNYEPGNLGDIGSDIKVDMTGAEDVAGSDNGKKAQLAIDGDPSTWWHSSNGGFDSDNPMELTISFPEPVEMDYFIYVPRNDNNVNGVWGEVEVYIETSANLQRTRAFSVEPVVEWDFKKQKNMARVDFPASQIDVTKVKFKIKSGANSNAAGKNLASCAEIEFYKENPEKFDYTALFEDKLCAKLKPGITLEEILNCQNAFYKNIAYYMWNNIYPSEFRIAEFKAGQNPKKDAQRNKTNQYGILDNPTGIAVTEGDELVVFADLNNASNVSLLIQNLNKPNGDGYGQGEKLILADGINRTVAKNDGLVYVIYNEEDNVFQPALPSIRLHFASGTVNGYYDSQNESLKGRWKELLGKATYSYFDVVGKYAHLVFPTSRFRNHTTDLKALIDAYDELVYNEQLLMGLVKYEKMFGNRMDFTVIYTSYMYSTTNHTGYNDNTLADLCDESKLTTSACWGPAHEVGHSNQTTGLKWAGMTEVTNNIKAEYIQTVVFKQPSRLQTETNGQGANRYEQAWNKILVGKLAHNWDSGSQFLKLVPFWQLQLYFGNVKGMSPEQGHQTDKGGFYPEVYEFLRENESSSNQGQQQLDFTVIASEMAGYDLTDFFEKWGFFREVNRDEVDYGKAHFEITQEMAASAKNEVKGKRLPDISGIALEYITDNNWEIFKKQSEVVEGTAAKSGNRISMKNWQNVVAYEVRENNEKGNLVYVSDRESFSVDNWEPNYKIYAVQYNNVRIEADL